jgi:hypothetical protein
LGRTAKGFALILGAARAAFRRRFGLDFDF